MWILDRSSLNHVNFSTEDAFQAKFEFKIPIEKSMIPLELDEHIYIT